MFTIQYGNLREGISMNGDQWWGQNSACTADDSTACGLPKEDIVEAAWESEMRTSHQSSHLKLKLEVQKGGISIISTLHATSLVLYPLFWLPDNN